MTGPRKNMVGQRFGKWTVKEFAGYASRGSGHLEMSVRLRDEETDLSKHVTRLHKGACDRCALLAKPRYQQVARWRSEGVPLAEMGRRLNLSQQRISQMVDVIETRTPKPRSKTHCPAGHRFTKANTEITPEGWRRCRTCRREKDRARVRK